MLAIARSLHVEDLGFIDESVDNRVRDGVVGEDLVELPKLQVGRGYSAKPLVMPCGDDLEEQIARLSVQLHVTELINDEDLRSSVLAQLTFEVEGLLSVGQVIDHVRRRDIEGGEPLLAGGVAERPRQMGFPLARGAREHGRRKVPGADTAVEREIR